MAPSDVKSSHPIARNPHCFKQRHRSTRRLLSNVRARRFPWTCSSSAQHTKMSLVWVRASIITRMIFELTCVAACLPHYTSGQTFFYPAFNASRTEDAIKFAHEFGEVLAMPVMLEAVMRVRASKGIKKNLNPRSFPSVTYIFDSRFADGIVPWQLFRQVYGPPRDARCAHRSIVCH